MRQSQTIDKVTHLCKFSSSWYVSLWLNYFVLRFIMVCLIIKKETAFCTSLVWVLIDHHIMWTYTQASFRFKDLLSCVTKFSTVFLLYKYRSVDGEGPYRSPRPAVRVSCLCSGPKIHKYIQLIETKSGLMTRHLIQY